MRCLVSSCEHDSSTSYGQGITFYMLPTQPSLREKWLKALGKEGWKSTEVSVVCSDHFLSKDLYLTKGGQRRLRAEAMPVLQNVPNYGCSVTPCDLKVCRICFATDCKLYSMTDYNNLNQAYQSLAGLMAEDEVELPSYLCTVCAHRLLNCARFRTRSLRAHLHLLELVKRHDRITLETIKSFNANQRLSCNLGVTHKTDHYDLDIVHVKTENEHNDESVLGEVPTGGLETRNDNAMIELEILNDGGTNNHSREYLPNLHQETILDDVKMEDGIGDPAISEEENTSNGELRTKVNANPDVNQARNVEIASSNNPHGNPVVVYIKAEGDTFMANENSLDDENTSDEDMSLASLRECNTVNGEAENNTAMSNISSNCEYSNNHMKRGDETVGEEVDVEWTPPHYLNDAQVSQNDSLPPHSHYRYITAYANFISWKKQKKSASFSEDVLMTYFQELSTKYKPSSLWSTYSMLKSTLKSKDDVDIKSYKELSEFIKRQSDGYTSKKAKVLTTDHVEKFLNDAPDQKYLLSKMCTDGGHHLLLCGPSARLLAINIKIAILIFGITGACRRKELANISLNDIENHGELLLVKIPDAKNKVPRTFTIHGQFYKVVKKYEALRVTTAKSSRFFQKYHNGKCFNQVVGANRIGSVPKEVATFLKLPDAESYTGHSFRRTSATLLANSGADLTTLKRQKHRTAVAEKNSTG